MKLRIATLLLLFFLTTALWSQDKFTGHFKKSGDSFYFLEKVSWNDILNHNQQLQGKGFSLIDLEVLPSEDGNSFWAIWEKNEIDTKLETVRDWKDLISKNRELTKEGFQLSQIETYFNENGQIFYAGIWKANPNKGEIWKLSSWTGLEKRVGLATRERFFLADLEVIETEYGETNFLAIFHKGAPNERSHVLSAKDQRSFMREKLQRQKSGYRLIDFENAIVDGQLKFIGIFKKGKEEDNIVHQLSAESFKAFKEYFLKKGYQLVDLEVFEGSGSDKRPPKDMNGAVTTTNEE